MAMIRCKMCGGDLLLQEGATTARCEYCGSLQTVPLVEQEKKLNLFTRADRLRRDCEFDKAYGVYEAILGEYPQEPEAYWGLVLCKYGIEYVDDPATARRIPTCHRSSYESVTEDSNYAMALKYADGEAEKLYRAEGETIEGIRRGIEEISLRETPYDIFICYKETDENGQRTLDSVLAQDIYDTLTHKGYRVFFSRVTLEDKVGLAYEPYIFAALNSAKVMLVVSTDYAHVNAVWVKNEWRRYLMLMQDDRSKHLIPCYKDMDIEDLPQEFRRLQAQDLGKVGAIQDLLRGIEKLLPRTGAVSAPKRKVTDARLERGITALEDRSWKEAEDCFCEVLEQDPENADAYLGRLMARERRKSLDAVVEKWLEMCNDTEAQPLNLVLETERYTPQSFIKEAEAFLDREALDALYQFGSEYTSEVESCMAQYQRGKKLWDEDPLLTAAAKCADETLSLELADARNRFLWELQDNLDHAQADAEEKERNLRQDFEEKRAEANKRAAELYQQAEEVLETHYQRLCQKSETECVPEHLSHIASQLESIGSYKDCSKRAKDLRAKVKELDQKRKWAEANLQQKRLEQTSEEAEDERAKGIVIGIISVIMFLLQLLALIFKNK